MDNYVKVVKVIDLHCHSGTEIILYYAIRGSTRVKNTKYKYTIKTYENRELQNRQQENITAINTEKQKSVNSMQPKESTKWVIYDLCQYH